MPAQTNKIARQIEKVLKATGLTYDMPRGNRHIIVELEGRQIGVLSISKNSSADGKNIIDAINRYVRQREKVH